MNRRSFWSALVGASSGAAATAAARPSTGVAIAHRVTCMCGMEMYRRTCEDRKTGGEHEYYECTNPTCEQRGRKFARPNIPLQPAAAAVVAKVDRAIEEERRAKEKATRIIVETNPGGATDTWRMWLATNRSNQKEAQERWNREFGSADYRPIWVE